jgi:hypothetical protein
MMIASNLHAALLRLRGATEVRILWADAVCIDQTNDPEKNHQVGIMGDIYKATKECIVWLGEPKRQAAFSATIGSIGTGNNAVADYFAQKPRFRLGSPEWYH